LIYAYGLSNIVITGEGTIDGSGKAGFANWKKFQSEDQTLIRKMGGNGVPINERIFGKGHYLRPSMI